MAVVVMATPMRSYIMTPKDEKRYKALYEDLLLSLKTQGMTKATVDSYSRAVRRIASRTNKSPDRLTKKDLRKYFAELVETHAWSTVRSDRCGLQFFYRHVLEKDWEWVTIVKPPQVKSLPDIMTMDEVYNVISAVKKHHYRTCIFTIYSLGLRLKEGITLRVEDVDSNRMLVHIRHAKGNKDRFVPLPKATLYALRKFWSTHRNSNLLFPSISGITEDVRFTKKPMDHGSMQRAMRLAVEFCGLKKKISIHSLRHSYATHLVEAGVNLRLIQEYLGHSSPVTTARYTHMTNVSQTNTEELINGLMRRYITKHGFLP